MGAKRVRQRRGQCVDYERAKELDLDLGDKIVVVENPVAALASRAKVRSASRMIVLQRRVA